MQPGLLLLFMCVLVIALTSVLCIWLYFDRTRVWVCCEDDDENDGHRRLRPRWIRSLSNYQTFAQPDLEQDGDDTPEGTPPRNDAQPIPPTRGDGGPPGRRSGLPRRPAPRTLYNYRNWDPEDGVIGVTYKQSSLEDEDEHAQQGRILDEETARRVEEHERHMNDPSPYDLDSALARGGSRPIPIPNKRTKRPTFPVPPKLIWQKLTPFEKAGAVWWRN